MLSFRTSVTHSILLIILITASTAASEHFWDKAAIPPPDFPRWFLPISLTPPSQAEAQSRAAPAAIPRLENPSAYHVPTPAIKARLSVAKGSLRVDTPAKFPPGVAALLAGADPSPSLTSMLMPKTIEVREHETSPLSSSSLSSSLGRSRLAATNSA